MKNKKNLIEESFNEFFMEKGGVENKVEFVLPSFSENEKIARNLVSCFLVDRNPLVEELNDIKTAVSEAVTNSIVHGYDKQDDGIIKVIVKVKDSFVFIQVIDYGKGIKDIKQAMQPFFTTIAGSERSGMGFTVMETFMDKVLVENGENDKGLVVSMLKNLSGGGV